MTLPTWGGRDVGLFEVERPNGRRIRLTQDHVVDLVMTVAEGRLGVSETAAVLTGDTGPR